MKVALYSGGQERSNAEIHRVVAGQRMAYLPYTLEGAKPFFRRFERRYAAFGATSFCCIAADDPQWSDKKRLREAQRELLRCDTIYLAGGNSFYFLAHLKRTGMFETLKRFAQRGGTIAGLSAGALILTPRIDLAGYPSFDSDENEIGLPQRRWSGLGLVDFEFFPHYRRSKRYREALLRYSEKSRRAIYACQDGGGLVRQGRQFTIFGDAWSR